MAMVPRPRTLGQKYSLDRDAAAKVAELSERDREFVAEPFVLLVQPAVGLP